MRPCSSTMILLTFFTVARRCAMTMVVRPCIATFNPSCTRISDSASSALVASSSSKSGAASDHRRTRALALRLDRHLEWQSDRRLLVSCDASRRPQLRTFAGKQLRSRIAARGALREYRSYARYDYAATVARAHGALLCRRHAAWTDGAAGRRSSGGVSAYLGFAAVSALAIFAQPSLDEFEPTFARQQWRGTDAPVIPTLASTAPDRYAATSITK